MKLVKAYLYVINPLLALAVLLICLYAAAADGGDFKPEQMFKGGIPTYFVAKGIFCCSAMFLLGMVAYMIRFGKRP